jgi:hypothetical protein
VLPQPFVTTTSYEAASPAPAGLIVSVAVVEPEILPTSVRLTPPFRHWYDVAPDAVTEKPADVPEHTVWAAGWPVIEGGRFAVSEAAEEVAVPHEFVTTAS